MKDTLAWQTKNYTGGLPSHQEPFSQKEQLLAQPQQPYWDITRRRPHILKAQPSDALARTMVGKRGSHT